MWKEHNVVMLPTNEKASNGYDLVLTDNNQLRIYHHSILGENHNFQHLYITSDEEIKKGEWYLINDKTYTSAVTNYKRPSSCKKIIATTDKSLNLPLIPESFINTFIEGYNKGKKIEKVLVEYDFDMSLGSDIAFNYPILKVSKDNTINIKLIKDSWTREEVTMNLIYCVSSVAAELGLTPTSIEMKKFNDLTNKWIEENL